MIVINREDNFYHLTFAISTAPNEKVHILLSIIIFTWSRLSKGGRPGIDLSGDMLLLKCICNLTGRQRQIIQFNSLPYYIEAFRDVVIIWNITIYLYITFETMMKMERLFFGSKRSIFHSKNIRSVNVGVSFILESVICSNYGIWCNDLHDVGLLIV